jgi:putative chitobiose transport system substrate-binding protein
MIIFFVQLVIFNSSQKNENQRTVVFWTLQLGTFDKYITNIISEFEKENPEIKIKWIDVPYSEGEKRTLASILTDNPPDLVNLTPDFSLLLAQKNALYPIDKKYLENYLPSLTETLKYNDEYFGIPFYATSAVTLYNKEIIEKANIKQLPITYDDLFAITQNLKPNYLTMINFSENDTLLKLLNKYNINSPQTITNTKSETLFKTFKKLYDENLIPKESVTQTHRDSLEKYMSGQIAFLVTGANFINMIKENAPQIYKKTDILPQLTGDTKAYDYSLMNFIVPKKSHNPQDAIKFAIYFTNKENQLEFAKMTTILPVNKEALNDEYFKTSSSQDLQSKSRFISAKQLNNLQKPLTNIKNKKELNTLSSNYIQEILINNANIDLTLKKFAKDWEKL